MVEIVKSGGWLMLPIILCAIVAMGIILERFWTLQQKRVIPEDLTSKVWGWVKKDQLDQKQIQTLHQGSALGQILAAGLINRDRDRLVLKDAIEDTGRHVVHELERYLETLGTVAAVTPLLGLLGTVIGMVQVFTAITTHGVGNPTVLAGGSFANRLPLLPLTRRHARRRHGERGDQARRGAASAPGQGWRQEEEKGP
jgi:biopolymer transport protein ExbB